jgi:3-hydroxy-3-methylglutaryl CoA synthase/uncharacterized OB-fold protein
MRGIVAWGTYLPYRRLDRAEIAAVAGQGGGRGRRTVASYDEDPTTMAVEAGRRALRTLQGGASSIDLALLCAVTPAYADRTNATALHAALRLAAEARAFDLGLSTRSGLGGLLVGFDGTGTTFIATADIRTGLAGSAEEANGGDAAVAFVVAEDAPDRHVVAHLLSSAGVTHEFVDRWRTPGETRSKVWDEKFAEVTYVPLGSKAWSEALIEAELVPGDITAAAVAAPTARIAKAMAGTLGGVTIVDDFSATVGQTGAAQPGLLLAHLLEQAAPGDVVALVTLADGAEALILQVTEAAAHYRPAVTVADQVAAGAPLQYGKFLAWRGTLAVEPPRRPEPPRVSATAAARSDDWKFGFVGSRDPQTGSIHLPPIRVSADGERTDQMEPWPMADAIGTVATYTVDRMVYSPSPPVVFAVVDFDDGGRLPIELCDCDADEVSVGSRVEMTFRRLYTADGIANYFWKGRLVRG